MITALNQLTMLPIDTPPFLCCLLVSKNGFKPKDDNMAAAQRLVVKCPSCRTGGQEMKHNEMEALDYIWYLIAERVVR